jgi:hypothetical protein
MIAKIDEERRGAEITLYETKRQGFPEQVGNSCRLTCIPANIERNGSRGNSKKVGGHTHESTVTTVVGTLKFLSRKTDG